jgi:hypothetical protein
MSMSFSYDWSSMSAMIALVFFLIAVILFVLAISFYSNTNLWISFGVFVILSPIIFLSGSDKN